VTSKWSAFPAVPTGVYENRRHTCAALVGTVPVTVARTHEADFANAVVANDVNVPLRSAASVAVPECSVAVSELSLKLVPVR